MPGLNGSLTSSLKSLTLILFTLHQQQQKALRKYKKANPLQIQSGSTAQGVHLGAHGARLPGFEFQPHPPITIHTTMDMFLNFSVPHAK